MFWVNVVKGRAGSAATEMDHAIYFVATAIEAVNQSKSLDF